MTPPGRQQPALPAARRTDVVVWALWDAGCNGMSAIVGTFVFAVYLTNAVGAGCTGDTSPASWLGRALTVAGLTVAALAPAVGVWVQHPRRRRRVLTLFTAAAVTLTAAMALIRPDCSYLFAGLALLAVATGCSDLASIPYNAMLTQVATPRTAGRISGFGWAAAYSGSVVLLLVIYVGFVAGGGDTRGLLGLPAAEGTNVRMAMLVTAGWFALFALPLLLRAHRIGAPDPDRGPPVGVARAYRQVWADLAAERRRDRNLVRFLLASALYRDGMVGVFVFGAVLGVNVYGVSAADVLIFGVAACVVAALGAAAGGLIDDRIGAKPVIVTALSCMIVLGLVLLVASGPTAFWVLGLALCLFIGPVQAASRTMLIRMSGAGREGVAFGLYTMTGRAVAFLGPWLFSVFVDVFDTVRAGMGGLIVVLVAGLAVLVTVRAPEHRRAAA